MVGLADDVGGMVGLGGSDVVGRDPSGGDADVGAGAAVVLIGGVDGTGVTASAAADEPDGAS